MAMCLRPMNQGDIDSAFGLTQQMKWPHRREDWQQALALGEGVVAEAQGRMLGTALCWHWGEACSTLGLVMVDGAVQGKGIGKQLMLAVMEKLSGAAVRLHATDAGINLYQRLGFVTVGEMRQHQCRVVGDIDPVPLPPGSTIRPAGRADAPLLARLDTRANGMARSRLMAALLRSAEQTLILTQDGVPWGFACLRHFGHGYAIGPVIAGDADSAVALIGRLLSGLRGGFVRIDTDGALGLSPWLTLRGLEQVDAPAIMIKGTPWRPKAGDMQAFALMTQALG